MKPSPRLIAALLLCATLSACSGGTPSESDGKAVYEHLLAQRLGSVPYTLNDFRKTNGQTQNFGGVEAYVLSYEADVTFPSGFHPECVRKAGQFAGFRCLIATSQGIKPRAIGERATDTGQMTFQKTEKGWVGEDQQIY